MTLKTVDWGESEDRGPVFFAQYPGTCEGCGDDFHEGDQVFYKDGDLYADHDCADKEEPRPETCPKCFQTFSASGACGC